MNRREFLFASVAACASAMLARGAESPAPPAPATAQAAKAFDKSRYKISAADWMMLKRQTPGALTRAKECDLDGVEVDMGPLGKRPDFEDHLVEEKFRTDYLAKAKELDLEISSFAMSAFYGQAFGKHDKAD